MRPKTLNPSTDLTRYHVPILARTLRVLEYLADHPKGCGIGGLAAALKIPKNTVFRILATLSDHGYLSRDSDGTNYRLERKLLTLGYAAVDEAGLVEKSMGVLRDLRDATGETALLAVLTGHEGVVLEQVPSVHPVKVTVQLGHQFPLHTAAPGKAFLAFLPAAERDALLGQLLLTKFTEKTLTARAVLAKHLDGVRACGYAVDNEEEMLGVRCVGAPVLNQRGYPVAAIWVTGPSSRLGVERLAAVGPVVREQAARISARFGYRALQVA